MGGAGALTSAQENEALRLRCWPGVHTVTSHPHYTLIS